MNTVGTSYLLWMLSFLGFCGMHRLYNRKFFTGFLWFFTLGLFGIGQFIDLFLIPGMVDDYNARLMFRRIFRTSYPPRNFRYTDTDAVPPRHSHTSSYDVPATPQQPSNHTSGQAPESDRQNQLMFKLLAAAEKRGGQLSVTQGVMDTGRSFADVEATLREMVKTGYIAMHNDPISGILIFDFIELKPLHQDQFHASAHDSINTSSKMASG